MDNVTVHKNTRGKELSEQAACDLLLLPVYSPDFNPIEHLFAKLKAFIRKLRPETLSKLMQAFADAVCAVQALDAANAFKHCAYQ